MTRSAGDLFGGITSTVVALAFGLPSTCSG